MSPKKIIFFIIAGILAVTVIIGAIMLSNSSNKKSGKGEIIVWTNEGVQEDFQKLIDGFEKFSPENKNIKVKIERQTSDPKKYRTLLLSTLANGNGPDIFMVPRGEDELLESYIQAIPNTSINIADFERRFDPKIFDNLIIDNPEEKSQFLLGVPLGYETLGAFYNSNLLSSGVPRDGNQIENLYSQSQGRFFPTNLGLSSLYTPNALDVIALFLATDNIDSYKNITSVVRPFFSYYGYGDLSIGTENSDNIYAQSNSLRETEANMSEVRLTTFDRFIRGEIAMIIGYPSLISELEKSYKRSNGKGAEDAKVFRTEKVPQFSLRNRHNVARFNYFGISKNSPNFDASAKFLEYLTSPDAQTIALDIFPYLLPAQIGFYTTIKNQPQALSSIFSRTRIDAFLPDDEKITIFDYGVKNVFDASLKENWNLLKTRKDATMLGNYIFKDITCEMAPYNQNSQVECE